MLQQPPFMVHVLQMELFLISTKKGKSGKAQISLKADWGSNDFAMDYRPVMGGEERREYIYNGLILYQQRKTS